MSRRDTKTIIKDQEFNLKYKINQLLTDNNNINDDINNINKYVNDSISTMNNDNKTLDSKCSSQEQQEAALNIVSQNIELVNILNYYLKASNNILELQCIKNNKALTESIIKEKQTVVETLKKQIEVYEKFLKKDKNINTKLQQQIKQIQTSINQTLTSQNKHLTDQELGISSKHCVKSMIKNIIIVAYSRMTSFSLRSGLSMNQVLFR